MSERLEGSAAPAPPGLRPQAFSALLAELARCPEVDPGAAWDELLRPGLVIGRFELLREIGRGGFGVVWEARDRELGRNVAFKAVRTGRNADVREERLLREAEAAAHLSHPNIVTLFDVGRGDRGPYLILELLHGETLARRLDRAAMSLPEALHVAVEVAKGLAHAHAEGVVHRDLTPGNVFLCRDGQVKVLDLGMAHAFGRRKIDGGTPAFMAPEQWSGAPEDERTDVFALGVIVYRMVAGRLPFSESGGGRPRTSRAAPALDVPAPQGALRELVARMLERDPVKRPRDAGEVLPILERLEAEARRPEPAAPRSRAARLVRSRKAIALLAAAALGAGALLAWQAHHQSRIRWALEEALPRIAELGDQGKYAAAFALAEEAEKLVPRNARLLRLWPQVSGVLDVETTPAGAEVYVKEYSAPDGEWRHLGRSPVRGVRMPLALYRWRIEKQGFVTSERVSDLDAAAGQQPLRFTLDPAGSIPPEMVHVPGASAGVKIFGLDQLPALRLGGYLIDRTEVTNREFKRFVDAGGYRRRELWQHEFLSNGKILPWERAMALFRDSTGRAGPATWVSGDYPDGQGDLPVTGVSWYEAAAYAAFVGKALPNVYQWSRAAGGSPSARMVPLSNFRGQGLATVASNPGIGPFGTYDMAGNAKEWVWNANGEKRFILGGGFNEPPYMFYMVDARSPLSREPTFGFRLAKPLDGDTAAASFDPIPWFVRDYRKETPVRPDVFQAFKREYAYDRGPLDAKVEALDDTSERWRKEKISFAAAYGGERVVAYLFTPRNVPPPYQLVVFFPPPSAISSRSSENLEMMRVVSPVVSSGRALLYPVYKSTYERGDAISSSYPTPTALYREHVIEWSQDLGRSIDYAETRADLDPRRLALMGVCWGAKLTPLLAAVDDRIKAGILIGGGLGPLEYAPDVDPFNFAPYARQPMLMVNGRYDFIYPVDIGQSPLFAVLGSPPKDKRHVVVEAGHVPPNDLLAKEVLDWLDRYLGAAR